MFTFDEDGTDSNLPYNLSNFSRSCFSDRSDAKILFANRVLFKNRSIEIDPHRSPMSSAEELGLCRVCASPFEGSAMFRLFDEAVGPLALAEIFLQVAGIVADSRLPKSCCSRCRNRLQEVEDLRALCQESDRKLRKMVGIEVKEEEPDEELNGSGIEAIPKVEMIELPETYSYWDDAENRLSSSDNDSDPEYVAKEGKVRKTRSRKQVKAETNRQVCAWYKMK